MKSHSIIKKKASANCFSRMLSQRELINYINFLMYIFTCLRILFLVASSYDEPRKMHNEVYTITTTITTK